MNEILKNNTDSNVETITPAVESVKPVNVEELTNKALAQEEKLNIASAQDKQASGENYEKILKEAKGLEDPSQALQKINKQIEDLKKEVADSKEDYKNLFVKYSYDAPGATASFQKSGVGSLAEKYAGMDSIVATIQKAREVSQTTKSEEKADGILGKWFGVKKTIPSEITPARAQAIENALTSGTPGLNAGSQSWKNVIEFLSKNDPELLKTQKYQDIINQLGQGDAEFMEANKTLLVKPAEVINQPTSIHESMGIWKEEKNAQIKELETKKLELEGKIQSVA
jgi:hypothetical protein